MKNLFRNKDLGLIMQGWQLAAETDEALVEKLFENRNQSLSLVNGFTFLLFRQECRCLDNLREISWNCF